MQEGGRDQLMSLPSNRVVNRNRRPRRSIMILASSICWGRGEVGGTELGLDVLSGVHGATVGAAFHPSNHPLPLLLLLLLHLGPTTFL